MCVSLNLRNSILIPSPRSQYLAPYASACSLCLFQFSVYIPASSFDFITCTFSAFFSSSAFVKLNDPVITVPLSMMMILLWAMACRASTYVGAPNCQSAARE
jgi:hypothetical protein